MPESSGAPLGAPASRRQQYQSRSLTGSARARRAAELSVTTSWTNRDEFPPRRALRAGFVARTKIDRDDYGMSWNGALENGGLVVGNDVLITIDAEAILDD